VTLATLPRPVLEAIRAEHGPMFVNEQQRAFFESRAPEVLYSGAFRAGKSRIGCEKAYDLAKRYPGIPIGIFRKTANSLAASTERTLLHDVIPSSAIARSNRTERWYELANGSRIWLFGLDPDPITGLPSKVGSVELGWAFIDEAAECSEADWTMVKGRLSWPGIPWHQIAAATNPARPTHWLKVRFTPSTEDRVYLHATTFDNRALPADYIDQARKMDGGYAKSRYIMGEWVAPADGALWTPGMIAYGQTPKVYPKGVETPDLARIVVAVDPAVTSKPDSDETGIVVVGLGSDKRAYVLDDLSLRATPADWARRAVQALKTYNADRIVAEANNGGDLVSTVIGAVDPLAPVTLVRAARGKVTRAEPVAALYEQGRVSHTHPFPELEDQMCSYTGAPGEDSPDRMDALVWAMSELFDIRVSDDKVWGSGPAWGAAA
jgi:predicted phage terminase large subunit-like protein